MTKAFVATCAVAVALLLASMAPGATADVDGVEEDAMSFAGCIRAILLPSTGDVAVSLVTEGAVGIVLSAGDGDAGFAAGLLVTPTTCSSGAVETNQALSNPLGAPPASAPGLP